MRLSIKQRRTTKRQSVLIFQIGHFSWTKLTKSFHHFDISLLSLIIGKWFKECDYFVDVEVTLIFRMWYLKERIASFQLWSFCWELLISKSFPSLLDLENSDFLFVLWEQSHTKTTTHGIVGGSGVGQYVDAPNLYFLTLSTYCFLIFFSLNLIILFSSLTRELMQKI